MSVQPDTPAIDPPRRSPRNRRLRYPELHRSLSEVEEDDEPQPRSRAATASKRSIARATASDGLEGGEEEKLQPASNGRKAQSRKRVRRTRDDPNSASGSIYAHLQGVPDLFAESNDIMFCGINPGVKSSSSGHHFAHRSNHFYPSLHLAGITEQRMKPEQDIEFPHLRPLSLGLTNLAGRPTAEGSELLPSELVAGVPVLLEKVRRWKPKTVCFVGKGIAEAFVKGLKQAGAIYKPSLSKVRGSGKERSINKQVAKLEDGIKCDESEPRLSVVPLEAQGDRTSGITFVTATIPSGVLCADPSAAPDVDGVGSQGGKTATKTTLSPRKGQKPLYTKGNSKDDTGYGLLPICVPHARRRGSAVDLEDVTLFFVTPSSSARVTTHFLDDKARILSSLRLLAQYLQMQQLQRCVPSTHAASNGVHQGEGNAEAGRKGGVKIEADEHPASDPCQMPSVGGATKNVRLELVDLQRFGLN